MTRIVIGGVPRAGKTTLAEKLCEEVPISALPYLLHTDDFIDQYEWSELSDMVSVQMETLKPPWIIEGVAAVRALRKWFKRNPKGKPCDKLIWLYEPLVTLTGGQLSMAKGCETVFGDIVGDLAYRHVTVERRVIDQA